MVIPKRNTGPNALRRGRASIPQANYFVTICVEPRAPVLIPEIGDAILAESQRLGADSSWLLRCMTVMPDHLHAFFTLGCRLTLSRLIARLKTKTRSLLRIRRADWQDNFYDRQLRPDDPVEAILRYIWLNPYDAQLITIGKPWPYFYCCAEDWTWFESLTDHGCPFPEWLQ
jgi:REP element-mobilizing transposase RayT